MVSLRVEGTQKHRLVNCDVTYYYEEGAAAPTDDDYEETCEHSSTREVAQWCAETRVLEAGDDDDDLAALRALKDRAAAAGRAAFLRAERLEPPPPPRKPDVPAVGAHLALRDDASAYAVADDDDFLRRWMSAHERAVFSSSSRSCGVLEVVHGPPRSFTFVASCSVN